MAAARHAEELNGGLDRPLERRAHDDDARAAAKARAPLAAAAASRGARLPIWPPFLRAYQRW